MSLSLKISKKVGGRSDMIASRSWPQNRISIGRGEECTLVLEDPRKHVSRVHVELEEKEEGKFHLTIVSKVNPVFVNGKKHAPGGQVDLAAGDRFELGEYELELLPPPNVTQRMDAVVPDVEETTRPDNPQLQLPKKPVPEKTVPVQPLAESAPAAAAPPPPPPPDPVFEEATFMGQKLPPVEPGIFDEPVAEAAPAAVPEPAAAPVPAPTPAPEEDVFAEATYVGASSNNKSPNIFDEATYVGGRPPQGGAAPAAAAAVAAARSGGAAGMRDAVSIFLDGAGLAGKEIRDAELEDFLRQSGKILRAAIEGSMALLAARATAKKELRAEDRTMVASKDNNPLKLMSDPQEAMAFLFDTKNRADGFLEPVQAVGDAFEDLRAHELALFAAMRAALLGAIQRFDPKMLEAELEKNAGGLGLNRKAKLWELFAGYQQKLARDAEDDFNKVFGREFMGTYMAQVKRLRSGGQ
ncbi:MAG: type VI secretion system-associated FHA domain protein TagH [Betaproteobacteria bacterium]